MKCEVLRKCTLTIEAGSIVEVDPLQFELARAYLKPIKEVKEIKAEKKTAKK